MPNTFNNETLDIFLSTVNDRLEWNGRNAAKWAAYFDNNNLGESLNHAFLRQDFIDQARMSELTDREVALAILSWGAMRYDHGARLFENESFIDVITAMRAGQLNRSEAYEAFYKLRAKGKIIGMGPAYYTKLICFANRDLDGYIMDQWTAKSMNLLTGSNMIKLSSAGMVLDKNTADVYETFCKHVEMLAEHTGLSPLDTEEAIFSYGGRRKGSWRRYVIANCGK